MLNKRAFSVLEIVFVVVILAIISSVAIPKLFLNKSNTYIIKAKSDVALIRKAINDDYNKQVMMQSSDEYIEKLDNATIDEKGLELFAGLEDRKLLAYPLISTNTEESKLGKWVKLSDSVYQVLIDAQKSVTFSYDKEDGTFECDKDEEFCMELLQ